MVIRTGLCDLLNIKIPVFQGAMAWIAGAKLAAAVSEAGGMGIIGAGNADCDWVKNEIDLLRQLTNKPFAVNLMLSSPHIEKVIDLVIKEQVPIVTTGGGNPGRFIDPLKRADVKIIPVIASVALAKRLSRLGVDALIAEGAESGGHIAEMSTMCLVPMVVDAVDIPVVAAGGIADARGFVAALALGAQGVQMGTCFICAEECNIHPAYQERVIKARDRDTVICGTVTGHPIRAIHNKFTRTYLQAEKNGLNKQALEEMGRGRYPAAAINGDLEGGTILAGQICGLVEKIQPAANIVTNIMQETEMVYRRIGGWQCHD